jgi:hypothetical protein
MYVHLCIIKVNDSNDTKYRREELEIFCYYKVCALPVRQYGVIRKVIWR